jgi:hypothetical protein
MKSSGGELEWRGEEMAVLDAGSSFTSVDRT